MHDHVLGHAETGLDRKVIREDALSSGQLENMHGRLSVV